MHYAFMKHAITRLAIVARPQSMVNKTDPYWTGHRVTLIQNSLCMHACVCACVCGGVGGGGMVQMFILQTIIQK